MLRFIPAFVLCAFSAGASSCLPMAAGEELDLSNQELRLTLLHTADIHSRLLPYEFAPLRTDTDLGLIPEAGPFGGATRMGALLKRERARADRVLHLDSGDCFQGAPIFNQSLGEVEFKFLSQMGLDAAVIGNHEFDAGALNFANQARDHARFPLLAANYVWDDYKELGSHQAALSSAPYAILTARGLKVGVIGMANLSSLNSIVEGGNSLQVTPIEQNEAARGYVELLKPVTDLIVLTSHLGLHEDQDLVHGYEAFYRYGQIRHFVERPTEKWQVLEWSGPEGQEDTVVRVRIPGVSGIDIIMGGHLHVVLNPPQLLTDPSGRKVLVAHSGAFAKYLGRLDVVVKMPPPEGAPEGAEVVSHDYRAFPLDGLWCDDAMRAHYKSQVWGEGVFVNLPEVKAAIARCTEQEDRETTHLLQPYIIDLDFNFSLTTLFGYAPRDIARRNNSTGGDSPLGNLAADSMRKRRRVEAEVAVTNSLGIRDNLYAGPLTEESMFNVFPFENTINIMYLSGTEMQEMLDFITERSSSRGCQSQAQVSGMRFTMDCAQVPLNDLRLPCNAELPAEQQGTDCPQENRDGRSKWQCLRDQATQTGRCWAHPATDISVAGRALDQAIVYKVAVNDYIAKGGSGFAVLKRNTTRIETGIPLRDSLIGYMQSFCSCEDILGDKRDELGNTLGKLGQTCGTLSEGRWVVDDQVMAFCRDTQAYQDGLAAVVRGCSCKDILRGRPGGCLNQQITAEMVSQCAARQGPGLGSCSCAEALQTRADNPTPCGQAVTQQVRNFCENPMKFPVAVGSEDGRIERRVK